MYPINLWEYTKTWVAFYILRDFRNLNEECITYMENEWLKRLKVSDRELRLVQKIIDYNKRKHLKP